MCNLLLKKVIINNRNLLLTTLLLCIYSCEEKKETSVTEKNNIESKSLIKYAQGFDLQSYSGHKKLIIKSPYPDAKQYQEFILISDKKYDFDGVNKLFIPIQKVVATSTTHIPMIEMLGEVNSIIGFPNTDYISSKKTRQRIKDGLVIDLGNEQNFNTEVLISLQPDALIASSTGNSTKIYQTIELNKIPVIYNGDWLEETPLGRAEWIKFFGALYNKDREADSIFQIIESEYLKAKNIAIKATKSPSIMSGVLYKDQWNLPAGESFTAQFFKDANTNYLWKDSKGQGSLVLGFEAVLENAQNADFWIGSGYYTTMEEVKNANAHYTQFKAFKKGMIYTFSKRRSENGGVEYFEFAPIQPHIVLKDLIKVMHPELLPDYQPYFLQRLE